MKVAFIHPDLGIGGAERLVLDVAVALKNQNIDSVFITNHFDSTHAFEEFKNEQFPVFVIGDWIPRSIFGKFQAVFAYIRMLFLAVCYVVFCYYKHKPDLFFVDQIPMANFILKIFGHKVIYYCHHPDLLASERQNILKKIYRLPIDTLEECGTRLSDIVLVNSKYTASIFYRTFRTTKQSVEILYPTISCSYLETIENATPKLVSQLLPKVTCKKNNVVYLSVNRFHPAKNLELAVQAMACLKLTLPTYDWNRIFLIVAGGYDAQNDTNKVYFNKLVKLAWDESVANKIVFLKSPSDSLKADLLLACDCLIYTPVNEHFGIVPLEAMAAGKPVIACDSGGPCETVEHNVSGFLSEPKPDAVAQYMQEFINKKELCKEMGLHGKERLHNKFSYDVFCKRVVDIVQAKPSA